MKIFPAILLLGALLVAGVAAGVDGYSLKSRATAGAHIDTASIRLSGASVGSEEPVPHGTEQCFGVGVCDDYAIWMALHAAP